MILSENSYSKYCSKEPFIRLLIKERVGWLLFLLVLVAEPPLKVVVVAFTRLLVVGHRVLVLLIHGVAELSLIQVLPTALAAIVLEFPVPV